MAILRKYFLLFVSLAALFLCVVALPSAATARPQQIAFIENNLTDFQTLVAGAKQRGMETVVLDSRKDGLAQMAEYLAQKEPGSVAAIHLLSHGGSGSINLGTLTLDGKNLNQHADTLARIGHALTADGDLLVYGCNVAEGSVGAAFIGELAQATGADVAASENLTGSAALGGDWALEKQSGVVKKSTALSALELARYDSVLGPNMSNATGVLARPGQVGTVWFENRGTNLFLAGTLSSGISRGVVEYSTDGGSNWTALSSGNSYTGPSNCLYRYRDTNAGDSTTTVSGHIGWHVGAGNTTTGFFVSMDLAPTDIGSDAAFVLSDSTQGNAIATLKPTDTGYTTGGFWTIDSQSVSNLVTLSQTPSSGNTATLSIGSGTLPAIGQTFTVTARFNDYFQTDSSGNPLNGQGYSKVLTFTVVDENTTIAGFSGDVAINTTTAGAQNMPAIAKLSTGNYVIVWHSAGQGDTTGSTGSIMGRIFDQYGTAQGSEFQISPQDTIDQINPSVTALANGRFVVAYQTAAAQSNTGDVVFRIVEANGTLGSEITANTITFHEQRDAVLATLSNGGFVVVWNSSASDDTGRRAYRRFDSTGTAIDATEQPLSSNDYAQTATSGIGVAALAGGGFVSTWADTGANGYVQMNIFNGTALSGPVNVNSSADYSPSASVAALTGGGFVVAYADVYVDASTPQYVKFSRYDNSGNRQGSESTVAVITAADFNTPVVTVTHLANGGFAVGWTSDVGDYSYGSSGVFARRYDASGTAADASPLQINAHRRGGQSHLALAEQGSGGIIGVWTDDQSNGSGNAGIEGRFASIATPAPTVTAISPTSGSTAGGTSVTITGTNFTGATAVTIGGAAATGVTVVSATSITATTPAGTAGAQDVAVTTPGGTGTGTGLYTYVTPAPTVTAISPTSGSTAGGTSVTITGTNFTGATAVTIGGAAATGVTVVSATSITATTPAGTAGAQDVAVTTPGGTGTGTGLYTYVTPAPTVTAISPTSGSTAGGTSVTITGTNFTGATAVTIGGAAATGVTVVSATSITATTPGGTAGARDVAVTTPGGTGTGTGLYTYVAPAANHTVTFDANSGTGTMAAQTANVSTALTTNSFTRSGYAFAGWNTLAGGGGTSYANGASYAFTADVTLYAQWTALPTKTVTFDNNGGAGTMTAQTANVATNLTTNTFTRSGYTFAGWNTLAVGGGTSYADGASYAFTADVTLYAQWAAVPTSPGAPTITGITPGNAQLSVAFTTGTTGGSAITNYEYSINNGGTFTAVSPAATASPIVIAGLTNGTTYQVQIRAVNAVGSGVATASTAGTPATTPSAPTITGITPGNAQLSVAFSVGPTGGSAVINYEYSTDNGGSFTAVSPAATTSPILITGLTNGTPYQVQIRAVNAMGSGAATASTAATPNPVVNGTCGAANAVTIAYAPAANLCSLGSASAVSNGASSWSWTCSGSGGGSTASCTAPKAQTTTGSGAGSFGITASSGATAWQVQSADFVSVASTAGSAPAGFSMPHGLLDLRLNSGTAGSSATVTITYPQALPANTVYWKFGKKASGSAAEWYQWTGAVIAGNTITLTLTDGALGDDDWTQNSLIVDPGGPGVPLSGDAAASVPTLSQWGQIALSALLALFGLSWLRRRNGPLLD